MQPQEVSLWIRVTVSNPPRPSAARNASGSTGWPHSNCSGSASSPQRRATSSHLSAKAPFMQHSTFRRVRLRSAPSITPQALLVARYTGSRVWKICRNGGCSAR